MKLSVAKKIDLVAQVAILLLALVAWGTQGGGGTLIFYFIMGFWQVSSCVIHHCAVPQLRSKERQQYAWTALIILFCTVLTFPLIIISGLFLLIGTPFIALWYMSICYREIKQLHSRAIKVEDHPTVPER